MPIYEYQCAACGKRFELIQKFSDPPLDACPQCGKGPVERLLSSPAFQFKGSGWYVTDYARKSESGGGEKTEKTEKTPSSEAKTEAKPESKTEKSEAKTTSSDSSASKD